MKKHVQRVLLPLLFSCCFVFFGSLNANALTIYDTEVVVPGGTGSSSAALWVDTGNTDRISINEYYFFDFSVTAGNTDSLTLAFTGNSWDIALDTENYDYWVQMIVEADKTMTYFPTTFSATKYESSTTSSANVTVSLSDVKISQYDGVQGASFMNRFSCMGKLPDNFEGNFRTIATTGSVGSIPSDISVFVAVHRFVKGTDADSVAALIAAINNQTNTLNGSIGQAADDIQQSIEDQYSGDPEEEFSVDDIITQHNEKMGVLSFGSDVMIQFLDMFQSANVGAAQLTLPGFTITVENQEHQVWPDYSFNFEQLNEWVPGLMSVIRMMLPAFVWLMVLRYIVNVFEKNFLSNGG